MADEFQGGTSAGGVTGNVTGSELAEVCQQSHMSVMGCNSVYKNSKHRVRGNQTA